ncbi:MAG TPA: nucleotide sugar dehydrogenase [Nevskiaceae bacterium]|nr:nucleotide sugar dehydrogenase [Nevskiaceae bacterium]
MNSLVAVESPHALPLPLSLTGEPVDIGVVGLGYVGMPLAAEFARHFPTHGLDVNTVRIAELRRCYDATLQLPAAALAAAVQLELTSQAEDLRGCNVYIVTVPTPIDRYKQPDLTLLGRASETVGKLLREGDIVIYESTVYPGATEEYCQPILEQASHLCCNRGFYLGYSPERINPGDEVHTFTRIKKITSGSTPEAAEFVDQLYGSVITAGTHRASSIRVAEAAKVIENAQRDVNIALINELAMLFHRLGIDTEEVLSAAGTKWNFLRFHPGLVGGHCIGVDPYYLTRKAQEIGFFPEMILAGRRINDGMADYVVESTAHLMTEHCLQLVCSRILVMGLTFKENCPDIRNSKVVGIVEGLQRFHAEVEVFDPWVHPADAQRTYGITPIEMPEQGTYDAIILAVKHDEFIRMGASGIHALGKPAGHVVFDVKHLLSASDVDGRL